MTSLDRLPLTAVPDLDPSQYNYLTTSTNRLVGAYYSPIDETWMIRGRDQGGFFTYRIPGIDATDWPEVWAEIISKEQAG